jgi:hypothetical protein
MDRFFQLRHDFKAESPQELSCKAGDIVVSANIPRGGWIKACPAGDRAQTGFVPMGYLRSVPDPATGADLTPTIDVKDTQAPTTVISDVYPEEPEFELPMEWSMAVGVANRGLHASQKIVEMLLQYTAGLENVPLTSLLSGLKHLQQFQDQERAEQVYLSKSLGIIDGADLARLMTVSCAAYGDLFLRVLQVIGPTETVETALLKDYTVVDQKSYSNLYHPGWLVLHHAERRELYLVIRGTSRVQDAVTDLVRFLIL